MAIFDYQCAQCDRIFDIYHRGKEDPAKVKCPSCGSSEYKKLVSIPGSVGKTADTIPDRCPAGISGGCHGGNCPMN